MGVCRRDDLPLGSVFAGTLSPGFGGHDKGQERQQSLSPADPPVPPAMPRGGDGRKPEATASQTPPEDRTKAIARTASSQRLVALLALFWHGMMSLTSFRHGKATTNSPRRSRFPGTVRSVVRRKLLLEKDLGRSGGSNSVAEC